MAQVCKVCAHRNTEEIEQLIVQGVPHTTIGKRFGVHFQSVRYHAEHHLPETLVQAVAESEANHAEGILSGINDLLKRTKRIMDDAEEKGYGRLELEAINSAKGTYELLSKIAVKLAEYEQAKGGSSGVDGAPRSLADIYDEENQEMGNLDMLTDSELATFTRLLGKIGGSIPEDSMDDNTRMFVEGTTESASYDNNNNNNSGQNSPRIEEIQHKNTQKIGGKGGRRMKRTKPASNDLDDLDLELDDLSLDEQDEEKSFPSTNSNHIPSEESDPKWMKEWRRKNPPRYYRPD